MDKRPQSRAPLIVAIVLLLLPVLYVGSYLALSDPYSYQDFNIATIETHYRYGGDAAKVLFWPLEQIDRTLRPKKWEAKKLF